MPDGTADTIAIEQKAYKSIQGIRKTPVDIVVGTESSFAERCRLPTLERTIMKEGVTIYG